MTKPCGKEANCAKFGTRNKNVSDTFGMGDKTVTDTFFGTRGETVPKKNLAWNMRRYQINI